MFKDDEFTRIPIRIQVALNRYLTSHIRPGHFLTAVLENNLVDAMSRADEECLTTLRDLVIFIYNEVPSKCWGSPEKVKKWINFETT
jgi:hypothetical protein